MGYFGRLRTILELKGFWVNGRCRVSAAEYVHVGGWESLCLSSSHPTYSPSDPSSCWELWTTEPKGTVSMLNIPSLPGGWNCLLLLSSVHSPLHFFSLLLCFCQISLGPMRHKALKRSWLTRLTIVNSPETALVVFFFFFPPRFLSSVWCLFTYSFPLRSGAALSLTFFYFFYWLLVKGWIQTKQDPAL